MHCRADRQLGHDSPLDAPTTQVPGASPATFEQATAQFIAKQIDAVLADVAGGGGPAAAIQSLPCARPSPNELVVVACPQPGVLFDFRGQAWFELRVRSNARSSGALYSVRGYLQVCVCLRVCVRAKCVG